MPIPGAIGRTLKLTPDLARPRRSPWTSWRPRPATTPSTVTTAADRPRRARARSRSQPQPGHDRHGQARARRSRSTPAPTGPPTRPSRSSGCATACPSRAPSGRRTGSALPTSAPSSAPSITVIRAGYATATLGHSHRPTGSRRRRGSRSSGCGSSTASSCGSPSDRAWCPRVEGSVLVRVQGGFKQKVVLRNGVARLRVSGLPKGKRALKISYLGSPTVSAGGQARHRHDALTQAGHSDRVVAAGVVGLDRGARRRRGSPDFLCGPSALATTDCIQA